MTDRAKRARTVRSAGLAAVVTLVVAIALSSASAGSAKNPAAAAPARTAGSYCYFGSMNGYGTYTGVIPYFHAGGFFQPTITITNLNVPLFFVGDLDFFLDRSTHQSIHIVLAPYKSLTTSKYTVLSGANGIPFSLQLDPTSDATLLAYKVCV